MAPWKRPPNVPQNAVWAGGPDGGAYILCTVDKVRDVNPCSVWNQSSGDMRSGSFRLEKEGRAASQSELNYEGAIITGDHQGTIYLKNGDFLVEQ